MAYVVRRWICAFLVVNSTARVCGVIDADSTGSLSRLERRARAYEHASAKLPISTARHSPQSLILVHQLSHLRMPGRAVAGELGKLEQKAKSLTPFEKEVAEATRRRDANKKRERALALRQSVTVRHRRGAADTFSACTATEDVQKRELFQIRAGHNVR